MKYCSKCGNKLEANNKYCPKCGSETNLLLEEKKKISEEKKEEQKEKLLLYLGTLLVIIASIIFAYANWNDMSSIFKILFLAIESLLFLSLSLFSKKMSEKMPYKVLWFIGISFIPIILNLIAVDKLLGDYLSYEGNGIYVYLSICSLICVIIYALSNKLLKSNIFLYVSLLFSYLTIAFIFCIFKFNERNILVPILSIVNLSICVFYSYIENDNLRKCLGRFISILIFIFTIITCNYLYYENYKYIITSITLLTSVISLILLIFKENKNVLIFAYPILSYILIDYGVNSILNGYTNVISFVILLASILINLIINLKDNKGLKIISFICLLHNLLYVLSINTNYVTMAINSIILIASFIFLIKITDDKFIKSCSIIILPINIYIFISSIINVFMKADSSIIYLITSIICFTAYTLMNQKRKPTLTNITFEVFSYIYLGFSSILILFTDSTLVTFILNEALWIYYFIYASIFKKNKAVNIVLLILLLINFVLCSIKFNICVNYSLLFVSIIMIILDLLSKNNKKSVYIYFLLVFTSLAALSDLNNINLIGISLTVLTYVFVYYLLIKKHSLKFVFKFIYTLVGFALIDSLLNYFLDNNTLIYILDLAIYLSLIISMFLLEVDTDRKVLGYSFIVMFPYTSLVNNVDFLYKYNVSFNVLLFVILILIYFEKVFKLKEKDRIIFEIVLLSIMHFITLFDILIVNFILGAFYIFYGFYKKRDSFTNLGLIVLLLTLIINASKLFDNISITYVLLIIGILMLTYVFYLEAKKKKIKE